MNIMNTRYQINHWSFYNYKYLEENLTSMAVKGWELVDIGGFLWKFKKAEPVKKKFAVLYANDETVINSKDQGSTLMLKEVYNNEDWQKIMEWKQLRIFSTNVNEAAPLKMNDSIRIESARDAMQKFILPGWITGFFLMLIIAIRFIVRQTYGLNNEGVFFEVIVCFSVAVLMVMALFGYVFWLKKSRKSINNGGSCIEIGGYYKFINIITIVLLALLTVGLFMSLQNIGSILKDGIETTVTYE